MLPQTAPERDASGPEVIAVRLYDEGAFPNNPQLPALVYHRAALDWHQLQNESEVFFLRIYGTGDFRWKGADLGVLVTRGRLQRPSDSGSDVLTIRAKHLIESIRGQYLGTPLTGIDVPALSGAK